MFVSRVNLAQKRYVKNSTCVQRGGATVATVFCSKIANGRRLNTYYVLSGSIIGPRMNMY